MYLYIYAFFHNNTIALQYTIYVIYKEYTFFINLHAQNIVQK